MTSTPRPDPAASAAAWYARTRADGVTDADRTRLTDWIREDAAHAEAWHHTVEIDSALDGIRDDPTIARLRAQALTPPARQAWRRWPVVAAAAAVLATAGLGGTIALHSSPRQPIVPTTAPATTDYATAAGETRRLTLPDGTILTLDARSRVAVHPAGVERRVDLLAGRAAFAVAKDAAHPFVVTSGGSTVTALGTHFSVDHGDGAAMQVALTEGKVRVETPAGRRVLAPGELLSLTGKALTVMPNAAATAGAWQSGRLTFDATPLADVVAALQRYDHRRLIIRDDALGAHPFSGSLRTTGGVDALIAALEAYRVARVVRQDAQTIVLTGR
ncbi:FecR domain-containing protein [Sphingomonas sp.]|jgi:transmembrane sensor|uniref:FecR family protein n=1 Tax=Sphingomonas sp. TaxID=28214 RepID=UPI0035C86C67